MKRTGLEMTEDGRYIVVKGRRWRASDPSIPEELKDELVRELMRARRAIKGGDMSARARVHAAKTALGERGEPWWEQTADGRRSRAVATVSALLSGRDGEPVHSREVAQVVGGEQWQNIVEIAMREAVGKQWALREHDGGLAVSQKPVARGGATTPEPKES
ncbi:DUF3253 domain-containing protein [Flaviflexus ciconiae]|uniref:DUF3253 domain-containing protein n=1 Tax=Flaviflexus ciconiae TaxID=2496867 RepID=A0A3Q9G8I6_9ACTO|nr:DUF3253 domain-containing protein [Flaviflexus ciconiae]AZQ78027.1 DUF3253 domain-containing protein [Flaviflexus ciconiae]